MKSLKVLVSPIGRITDISLSVIEQLKEIDYLFCEDTRVTKKIISKFEIRTMNKLQILNDANEVKVIDKIIELIKKNKNVGIISDAGYPIINDPGFKLIEKCKQNKIEIDVLGGTSAMLSALLISNFETTPFSFDGYLVFNKKTKTLEKIKKSITNEGTTIFFLAKHDINSFGKLVKENFPRNEFAIVKEISKMNQKMYDGIGENIIDNIPEDEKRGEFVVLVKGTLGRRTLEKKKIAIEIINIINDVDLGVKEKARKIALASGENLNAIYSALIKK